MRKAIAYVRQFVDGKLSEIGGVAVKVRDHNKVTGILIITEGYIGPKDQHKKKRENDASPRVDSNRLSCQMSLQGD